VDSCGGRSVVTPQVVSRAMVGPILENTSGEFECCLQGACAGSVVFLALYWAIKDAGCFVLVLCARVADGQPDISALRCSICFQG
jgi:hypothetical protein